MPKIRTRFAPSPTGFLHIGGLRTALFAYLLAKNAGGKFILRIEDTDQKRKVENAREKMIEILEWAGLKFDEGPHVGGEFGPYVQTERRAVYDKYRDELLAKGGAYYCFCTPERLEKMRAGQQAEKQAPRYDRACRDLSPEEVKKRLAAGEKYVIRQKMPLSGEVVADDALRGPIKFRAEELEDHVLIKSNGIPTYQFAVVVDDHLMEITHVTRTEEWLPSFPKNILLYRAFGWEPPVFAHFPFVANKGGGKLSKRQGDVAVEDFRDKGYLPEALLNFNVLLGWHPAGDNEILSLGEMEKLFDYREVGISPAVFDIEKLDYFNGYYIRQKPLDELTELCLPFFMDHDACPVKGQNYESKVKINGHGFEYDYIKSVVRLEQERLKKLSEIKELTEFFFVDRPEYEPELLIWKKMTAAEVKNNLEETHEVLEKIPDKNWAGKTIEEAMMSHIRAREAGAGEYLWPMRAALTGRKASPGPFDVAEVLGKDRGLARIKQAIGKL